MNNDLGRVFDDVRQLGTTPDWDDYFLLVAAAVSTRAKCTRRRVGAVLVQDKRIIAAGYNGAPSGMIDCLQGGCPRGKLSYDEIKAFSSYDDPASPGYCLAVHAEVNAILHATRDTRGATIYITDQPCPGCLKQIAAAGIVRAVYMTPDGQTELDPKVALLPMLSREGLIS